MRSKVELEVLKGLRNALRRHVFEYSAEGSEESQLSQVHYYLQIMRDISTVNSVLDSNVHTPSGLSLCQHNVENHYLFPFELKKKTSWHFPPLVRSRGCVIRDPAYVSLLLLSGIVGLKYASTDHLQQSRQNI